MNTINQTVYGYIRVSTKEQNEERQVIALRESGVTDNHIWAARTKMQRRSAMRYAS